MSAYALGWHSDIGLHFLRLFASGVFDRFPRLRLLVGHMGEMLPFMGDRIERFVLRWQARERCFRKVWEESIWVTTSGMFTLASLTCLLRTVSVERILFGIDYPFESNQQGSQFIKDIQESRLVTDEELAMITYRNAEALLKVKVEV